MITGRKTAGPGAGRRRLAQDRWLGFIGAALELEAEAHGGPDPADAPASAGDQTDVRRRRRAPATIGEPIRRAEGDDKLGSSRWWTLPRISADGGSVGPLTVRAASVAGRQHARGGGSREDALAFRSTPDGVVVIATADGVGDTAAKYSAIGAHIASVLSCHLVHLWLTKPHPLNPIDPVDPVAACREIARWMPELAERYVEEHFVPTRFATTLTTSWIYPDGTYQGFKVGDGGVFELNRGELSQLSSRYGGSYGRTAALPAGYAQATEFAGRLPPGGCLLLATDGLAEPLGSPDVAAALAAAWRQPPSVLDFLTDLSFERRGESDDRTAVCVWFDPERAGHPERAGQPERAGR